jgi:hypothetical protein
MDRKSNRTGGWRRADATISGRRAASPAREPTGRGGGAVALSEGAERVSEGIEWAWGVVRRRDKGPGSINSSGRMRT